MTALSDYAEDKLNDHLLGTTSFTMPATVYIALYTSDPTDADVGTEVSGGSYARQAITFAASSGGVAATDATVTFPVATLSWGTITHFGLRDALTSGNLLVHGQFASSKTVGAGGEFTIPSGDLTVTAA